MTALVRLFAMAPPSSSQHLKAPEDCLTPLEEKTP